MSAGSRRFDPALPGLEVALDRDAVAPTLAALLGEERSDGLRVVSADVVKHKPGRRCAIVYSLEGREGPLRLFAKVFGSDRGASVLTTMARVAEAVAGSELRVPRPVGYEPRLHLLVTEFLEGTSLGAALYCGASEVSAVRMAASIAALHAAQASLPRRWTAHREVRNTAEWIAKLTGRGGTPGGRALELLGRLEREAERLPATDDTVVHRDFYADQVRDCGGATAILDLDDVRCGDPAVDVGNFLAHLALRPLQFPETAGACARARAPFLEAYRQRREGALGAGFAQRVRFYEAASLLRLSGVYAGRPRWSGSLPRALLEACERVLAELLRS